MRTPILTAAILLCLACGPTYAQDTKLPEMGSSADELLTPARQEEYGKMMLAELRNYGYVLEDPLIGDWIEDIGTRLGAASDQPSQKFTVFMLRERQINAFATLGGYIAVNSGLVLAADNEDEVAAVLSHEMAHITQHHVLRAVERAKRDRIPILIGMLAAVVAAQQAGGNSSDDAAIAGITSGLGLLQQRQIDYTRSNESEADRLGIRTLFRSGYDVDAMADFFEKMAMLMRADSGGYQVPDFLQTHPVTTIRISEARARAEQMKKNTVLLTTTVPGGVRQERVDPSDISVDAASNTPGNLLLPGTFQLPADSAARGPTGQFAWAKERLRVLSANTPNDAIREYEGIRNGGKVGLTDAQQYGLLLAEMRNNDDPAVIAHKLGALLEKHPDNLWVELALGQAQAKAGMHAQADKRFDSLLAQRSDNRAIALTYADVLNQQGTPAAGRRAQAMLQPLIHQLADDPVFQKSYARACELAGDTIRASEAHAEAAYLNGHPEQALSQLQMLKKRSDLDYVTRARIDARITTITPEVLEMRRQGIRN